MQGSLSEQSAADVLSKVQGLQASGVLRVENGKTIRQLFIDTGSVIRFAASNLPAEGLTSVLKQKAGVTDDHLRQATAAKKQNELLGTALVRLGVLESARLGELTQEHVGQVLRAILSLKEGRFRFQAGDLPFRDQVDGGRSIAEILLQWGRDSSDPVQIRYRLGSPDSYVRRAQRPPAGFQNIPLDAAEGYALSRLDVPTSLRDLCTLSPVPEQTTLRAIYALRLAGMVKIVAADDDDRPALQIVDPRPVGQSSPAPAETADPSPLQTSTPPAEPATPSHEEVMPPAEAATQPEAGVAPGPSPEITVTSQAAPTPDDNSPPIEDAGRDAGPSTPTQAPAPGSPEVSSAAVSPSRVPGNGGAPQPEASQSGPSQPEPTQPEPPQPSVAQVERVRPMSDLERDMMVRFEHLHEQTMYEVLGIESEAGTTDIRRAYYALARTLHPDKFRQDDMKAKAEKVFARITEAYSTLSDEVMRGKYDEELARRAGKGRDEAQVDPAVMARLNFNRGKEHYEKGKYPQALSFFENACQQDATKGAYYQYLGMTQAHNPRLRKQAAKNLHKAIDLDPASAEPYAQLGSLYVRLGQKDRGYEMFRKALEWDANNEVAQRGLGGVQKKDEKRGFLGMFGKKKSAAS
jgi:curved DNA-binding protein CbpA